MNVKLGSGDETLMPLLAGWGSQPEADTGSGIGGTFGATFSATAAIERIAKIAATVISGGGSEFLENPRRDPPINPDQELPP